MVLLLLAASPMIAALIVATRAPHEITTASWCTEKSTAVGLITRVLALFSFFDR